MKGGYRAGESAVCLGSGVSGQQRHLASLPSQLVSLVADAEQKSERPVCLKRSRGRGRSIPCDVEKERGGGLIGCLPQSFDHLTINHASFSRRSRGGE